MDLGLPVQPGPVVKSLGLVHSPPPQLIDQPHKSVSTTRGTQTVSHRHPTNKQNGSLCKPQCHSKLLDAGNSAEWCNLPDCVGCATYRERVKSCSPRGVLSASIPDFSALDPSEFAVVSVWIDLEHEARQPASPDGSDGQPKQKLAKHGYNLTQTMTNVAPYVVYCGKRCDSVVQARQPAGRWGPTITRPGWTMGKIFELIARQTGTTVAAVREAAEWCISTKWRCPSAELILLYLVKPLLVELELAAAPQAKGFAWVDAGYSPYMDSKKWPIKPPFPWLNPQLWPDKGIAVRPHREACKRTSPGRRRRKECPIGCIFYGGAKSWRGFIKSYRKYLRHLIQSRAEWHKRPGFQPLCADQDVMMEVGYFKSGKMKRSLRPGNNWGWDGGG